MIIQGDVAGYWVAQQMGSSFHADGATAIGLERNGRIVAGIFFENYTGRSMTCHWAIKGRINKEFLHAIAVYAFIQCGVHKLIAPIESTNVPMVCLAFKLGFQFEAEIADAGRDGDIYIYTITKEQCRFLEGRYSGKTLTAAVA